MSQARITFTVTNSRKATHMPYNNDPLAAYHAAQNVDEALARLWSATRPKETSTLLRNLRAHAYSYAMSDAELCDDLRAAIATIEGTQ